MAGFGSGHRRPGRAEGEVVQVLCLRNCPLRRHYTRTGFLRLESLERQETS